MSEARRALLRALRDEKVEMCFRLNSQEVLAAYWGVDNDYPLGVVSRAVQRGYVERLRDVTYGENEVLNAWICGLTDAGRAALTRLEQQEVRHG